MDTSFLGFKSSLTTSWLPKVDLDKETVTFIGSGCGELQMTWFDSKSKTSKDWFSSLDIDHLGMSE